MQGREQGKLHRLCHSFSRPENSKAPCQLLRLPGPSDPETGPELLERGNCAGWTGPNKSWALRGATAAAAFPLPHTRQARSAHASVLWKGSIFPAGRREVCGFCILIPTPLWLASVRFLAPSFCIPQAYYFSNELFLTLVSSYLAGVWAVTGICMLARQGPVRWLRAGNV